MTHITKKVKLLHQSIKIIKFNKIDSHFALLKEILHKLETPYHFIKDIAAIKRNRDIILSKLNTILNKYEKNIFNLGILTHYGIMSIANRIKIKI